MSTKVQLLALLQLEGLGTEQVRQWIQTFGSLSAVFEARPEALIEAGVPERAAHLIASADEESLWDLEMQLMDYEAERGVRFIPFDEPEYPPNLRKLDDPPLFLWCRGEILPRDQRAAAMVGARQASWRGEQNAERIAATLAAQGVTVVSGLAHGIDTAAHQGALQAGGRTIAVLGSGIEVIVPEENQELADRIARQGAVVSALPRPNAYPSRHHLLARNAIVTGLSQAVIVVEAEPESGSVDAGWKALEQGRPLLVVAPEQGIPAGNRQLIEAGGLPVRHMGDLLEILEEAMSTEE
jgi:DNA processing protein